MCLLLHLDVTGVLQMLYNAAALDYGKGAKERGCDLVKVWDSTLDMKTRPTHRECDGQVRELDENFKNANGEAKAPGQFGIASEDINCRCAVLIKPRWDVDSRFTKRDNQSGELKEFEGVKNYQEFKKRYWEAEKNAAENPRESVDKTSAKSYNKGRGSGNVSQYSEHFYEKIGEIDFYDKNAIAKSLQEFELKYSDSQIEHCRVICSNGDIFEVHGDLDTVNTYILGDKLKGSINEHNHVKGRSQYSFSWDDLRTSIDDGSKIVLAYDEKYRYSMHFPDTPIDSDTAYEAKMQAKQIVYDKIINGANISSDQLQHEMINEACKILKIRYERVSL